jgi:hypothetical protein
MRFRWPEGTVFRQVPLDVEQVCCDCCGGLLHVHEKRHHRIYSLLGPLELCCRLKRCANPACSTRPATLSPSAELSLALPGWLIGWDVFCFIGHRRFSRHWSVPQIKNELSDTYRIDLSQDAICLYVRRYQAMVAARQQDLDLLRLAYRDVSALWLSIDGLQPEKGHETLYAVRELNAGRVWFAQALLSSTTDEVRRLLARAREIARTLGKPVRLWISDKQDAFVKAIRAEFPGVPHRYCQNHFLRDLAKPTLEADSHAKVQMRKKVRGLRAVEVDASRDRQTKAEESMPQRVTTRAAGEAAERRKARTRIGASHRGQASGAAEDSLAQVVLDYCCAVRGILNDDQGGPLHPPGLRMAEALVEVRQSLQRVLALNQSGPAHGQLERLTGCLDQGLTAVAEQQQQVREQVAAIKAVAEVLEAPTESPSRRRTRFRRLMRQYQGEGGEFCGRLAKGMKAWQAGLFVAVRGSNGASAPKDNLELERWFRRPKGHERKIHGRRHAGVRMVQEGATLLLVLDAHESHPEPFTAQDLLPYRHAEEPIDQLRAIQRRKVMRKARSPKNDRSSSPTSSDDTQQADSAFIG